MSQYETNLEDYCLFIKKNPIIFKKYKVIRKLCSGAFGNIYLGFSLKNNSYVAIKVEPRNIPNQHLENEAYFLYSLKGIGIPEILSYGRTKYYNVLVEPFLGKSLFNLYEENNRHFDIKDFCLMGIQIIDRLEWIHSKNVIHRDIKPDNFLVGYNNPNLLYLIDFGLSVKYRSSSSGKHIKFGFTGKITGTTKYSSINSIRGVEQSRKDDLESVAYMIIFFMKGFLPWQNVESKDEDNKYYKIYMMKKNIHERKLCEGLPDEIYSFLKYTKNLGFEEEPDYNYLRTLFKKLLFKHNIIYNDSLTFSWANNNINPNKALLNLYRRKSNFHSRLFKQIQNNLKLKENNNYISSKSSYKKNLKNESEYIYNNKKNYKNKKLMGNIKINSIKYNNNICITKEINERRKKSLSNKKNVFENLTDYNYSINNINSNYIESKKKIPVRKMNIEKFGPNLLDYSNKNKIIFNKGNNKEVNINKKNNKNSCQNYRKKEKILNNELFWGQDEYSNRAENDEHLTPTNIENIQNINTIKHFKSYKAPKVNYYFVNSFSKNKFNNSKIFIEKERKNGDNNKIIYQRNNKTTNIKYIDKIENNNYNYYSIIPIKGYKSSETQNFHMNNTSPRNTSNFNEDFYLKSINNFNICHNINCF